VCHEQLLEGPAASAKHLLPNFTTIVA